MFAPVSTMIEDIKGNVALGKRMRELRQAAGLTQAEVAVRMGCTQKDISRWEHGREIMASTAYRFCRAVGCKLADLAGE